MNQRRVRGGRIACANNTAAAAAAARAQQAANEQRAAQAAAAGTDCAAVCSQSVSAQFYGADVSRYGDVPKTCCDPIRGCREYPIGRRNAFWPTFARPRWLSCSQLYNSRNQRD